GVAEGRAEARGLTAALFADEAPRAGAVWSLYETFDVFARELDQITERLGEPVRAALLDSDRPVASVPVGRLAGFASQLALYRLLSAFGVEPRQVAGVGLGEVAAAWAAGALSRDDACALAVALAGEQGDPPAVSIRAEVPRIPLVRGHNGRPVTVERLGDPEFWAAAVRSPNQLPDVVAQLLGQGVTRFVDLGPAARLAPLVARSAVRAGEPGRTVLPVALLAAAERPGGTARAVLAALATLYADGVPVDWEPALRRQARFVDLPTYPFERRRFWLAPPDGDGPVPPRPALAHPLLGTAIELATAGDEWFGGQIADRTPAAAGLPRVHASAMLSAAALVDWALAAARPDQPTVQAPRTLREILLHPALELPADGTPVSQRTVRERQPDGVRVRGFLRSGASWEPSFTAHAGDPDAGPSSSPGVDPVPLSPDEDRTEWWRHRRWELGAQDGPATVRVTALRAATGRAEARLECAPPPAGSWLLAPEQLEAVLQLAALADDAAAPG
ncbi:acyltransferase domain-containing protein, partial [Frankia sp. AiPs1]|uniref:acyltransferase domain-containing protein n=1 Tax=Frankia sp. AiPs1 TaxID=573493 RepID=UPI002043F4D4